MQTNDDLWLSERDAWGADRLAWEDDEGDARADPDQPAEPAPEDPRY